MIQSPPQPLNRVVIMVAQPPKRRLCALCANVFTIFALVVAIAFLVTPILLALSANCLHEMDHLLSATNEMAEQAKQSMTKNRLQRINNHTWKEAQAVFLKPVNHSGYPAPVPEGSTFLRMVIAHDGLSTDPEKFIYFDLLERADGLTALGSKKHPGLKSAQLGDHAGDSDATIQFELIFPDSTLWSQGQQCDTRSGSVDIDYYGYTDQGAYTDQGYHWKFVPQVEFERRSPSHRNVRKQYFDITNLSILLSQEYSSWQSTTTNCLVPYYNFDAFHLLNDTQTPNSWRFYGGRTEELSTALEFWSSESLGPVREASVRVVVIVSIH